MASQSDASNARFSGLIKPIRDLALNWDVDIAHTLEDYLDELDQIRLPAHVLASANSSTTLQNLNFAEAALLIQGSTCVYSKKVEHLHNLVFQALDLISANKEGGKVSSEASWLTVWIFASRLNTTKRYLLRTSTGM